MNVDDVKKTLSNYDELEKRARDVLEAGGIHFGGVDSIGLDGDYVNIYYWATCHGELYHEEERLPVKMLADGIDIYVEWSKVSEEREKNQKRAEASAKRAVKRAERAEAKKKVKTCLAELKRLKKQYPDICSGL